MNAIERLKSQHREVESLFAAIKGTSAVGERDRLFGTLAEKLLAHMDVEEEVFYPAAYQVDGDEVRHAVEEHADVRPMIEETLRWGAGDAGFSRRVAQIEKAIAHHVKEEEQDLFPKVRAALGAETLDDLGDEMVDHQDERTSAAALRPGTASSSVQPAQ